MNLICRFAPAIAATALLAACAVVSAQQEFPPPQGKGPVVVVASGISGPEHYKKIASDIAALGYDAVLFDGSAMRSAIVQAQQMPHALPGKVAIVGFSAGGGEAVIYATGWPDLVTGVIAWFPATSVIHNVPRWVDHLQVPVLLFAGEKDHYRDNCCTADSDRALAAAAKAAGKPVDLYTYPKAEHDFSRGGIHYNAEADADAFQKTADKLKAILPVS